MTDHRPDDWHPGWVCMPPVGTRRRPERPTHGAAAALVAERLGTPYMPFQQHIADVACEYDPDTGLFCYDLVVIIIPRQSGKTTVIVLSLMVMRGIKWPKQAMVFTAQDRNHAHDKFFDDFVPRMQQAPGFRDKKDFVVRRSNGSERITFANGSYIYISATGPHSGHSKTLDMPVVDEAWYHNTTDIDSGFRVPMITRKRIEPGAQQLVVTAGGEQGRSVYLDSKRDIGARAVLADKGHGVAFFDYTCPADMDPLDPSNWWHFIPALGHTIEEEDIASELDAMDEADWLRAYASRDKPAKTVSAVKITPQAWADRTDVESHVDGPAVVGVAVSKSASSGALVIVGERGDGVPHVDHVKTANGTGWIVDDVRTMLAAWPDLKVAAIDGGGPASPLLPSFAAAGIEVVKLNTREFAQACGQLALAVNGGTLHHRGQQQMADAVARATTRPLADLWAWRRGDGDASIVELEAASVALRALSELDDTEDEAGSVLLSRGGVFDWDKV